MPEKNVHSADSQGSINSLFKVPNKYCTEGSVNRGCFQASYVDVWTALPLLSVFAVPVLVCEHVDKVTSLRVRLLVEPARFITYVLLTYKQQAKTLLEC